MHKVTRGSGILEGLLAKLRASKANSLISNKLRDGRILDIGCGSYPYFLVTTKFKEKYGIDPSVRVDLQDQENIKLFKKTIGDERLSFEDNFFDTVTMLAVFEHIEEKTLIVILKEIKRVLKKGGRLVITTPAPWSDKLLHQMARYGLISKEEIHEHKHNLSRGKIESLIENGGFAKEKINSGFFEFRLNMWFVAEK